MVGYTPKGKTEDASIITGSEAKDLLTRSVYAAIKRTSDTLRDALALGEFGVETSVPQWMADKVRTTFEAQGFKVYCTYHGDKVYLSIRLEGFNPIK